MAIVITLEVDDKGTAKIKKFSNETDKSLKKATKSGSALNKELGPGFDKVGKKALSATTAIAKFGVALSVTSIAVAAAGIALVTKEAATLEQKMDFLGAVLKDKTEAGFSDLSETVLQLGRDTEWMSTQVAEAGEQLAKAGFSTQEIISALPATLNLATAGTLELAEAAQITGSTLRAFGVDASETEKVTDVLAKTAISTNTTIQTIGESMRYIAPLARTAGISLQETSAAIGMLGNVGISASMAGTTLRAALAALLSPSREQAALMEELGINVKDADGNLISFTEVIRQLEVAGANTGEMLELFGRRGGPGMAALVSQGSEALSEFTTELENAGGTAQNVADEKLDNFLGKITILRSSVQNFMIALGDPLLDNFASIIETRIIPAVNNMFNWVKENDTQVRAFGQSLSTFFGVVLDSISSFASFMQSTGIPIIATSFKTIGDTVGFASAMVITFIDSISWLGEQFSKLPTAIQLATGPLYPMLKAFEEINESSTGFRDGIEEIGVTSIDVGNRLSDMSMKVGDMVWGLQNATEKTEQLKVKEDDLISSTSTLITKEGDLSKALVDTQTEFGYTQDSVNDLATETESLEETTLSSTDSMVGSVNNLAGAWDGVSDSINNTNKSFDVYGAKVAESKITSPETKQNQEQATYEAEIRTDLLKDYVSSLHNLPAGAIRSGPAAGIPIPRFFELGGNVPGSPNEIVPALLHGGEQINSSNQNGQPMIIKVMVGERQLAETILDINEQNVSGFKNTFAPPKPNIKSLQEVGV